MILITFEETILKMANEKGFSTARGFLQNCAVNGVSMRYIASQAGFSRQMVKVFADDVGVKFKACKALSRAEKKAKSSGYSSILGYFLKNPGVSWEEHAKNLEVSVSTVRRLYDEALKKV